MSRGAFAPSSRKGQRFCGGFGCKNEVAAPGKLLCAACDARLAGVREELAKDTVEREYNGRKRNAGKLHPDE